MKITYDAAKRQATLDERGLDFMDAVELFKGDVFEVEDTRKDYGECRVICYGKIGDARVVVGYVQRGKTRHIFSMRKCHEKEWKKIGL